MEKGDRQDAKDARVREIEGQEDDSAGSSNPLASLASWRFIPS